MPISTKPLCWVASSKKDLMAMPEEVQDTFGYALHLAQNGQKHPDAKPLKGFGSAGVLEVVEAYQGSATPKPDMELIKTRLKAIVASLGAKK